MPRRATRSANCQREIADSSVALPKDRMPWAYSERASSHRRRSSTSPSGKRRLRATESETVSVMLIVLLRVYAAGSRVCNAGGAGVRPCLVDTNAILRAADLAWAHLSG